MTNYLDELLEQREQEEAVSLIEWRKRRVYGADPQGTVSLIEWSKRRKPQGTVWTDHGAQSAFVTRRKDDEVSRAQEKAMGAAQLLQQAQRLHRAVRQVGEQGRRTASSQTTVQWDAAAGRHGTALSSRRTADYAAAVDMAFQRDARRYDGPMELPR